MSTKEDSVTKKSSTCYDDSKVYVVLKVTYLWHKVCGMLGRDPELGLRYAKSPYAKFQLLKQWKFVIARLSIA